MRIFFKDGSSISEITNKINRYNLDTFLLTITSGDAIYIASDFPMNHFFVKMGDVVNQETTAINVHYWSNDNWAPVVHLNDYTDGFSQSGFIEFTPDRDSSWDMKDTNGLGTPIIGLEDVVVYDQYWTRLTFEGNVTPSIELKYIGHKFSDDLDLFAEFPIFDDNDFLTAFSAGKTDWEEQAVRAADLIIQDMKRKNIIIGAEQILDRSVLLPASVSKIAEIIFNAFGKDYVEIKTRSRQEYDKRMDLSRYAVDVNNNGIEDKHDRDFNQGWLSR